MNGGSLHTYTCLTMIVVLYLYNIATGLVIKTGQGGSRKWHLNGLEIHACKYKNAIIKEP